MPPKDIQGYKVQLKVQTYWRSILRRLITFRHLSSSFSTNNLVSAGEVCVGSPPRSTKRLATSLFSMDFLTPWYSAWVIGSGVPPVTAMPIYELTS